MTFGISSQIDDKFLEFAGNLPHGSGIDCDWSAHETKNYVYFTNSYHCMDEWGMYEGYQDFSVRVDRAEFENGDYEAMAHNFKVQFNGDRYLSVKNMLRDYLEDTIFWAISENK